MNRDNLTNSHGKDIVFRQGFSQRPRHVGIVTIGPCGEEITRLEGRLTIGVNVNWNTIERFGYVSGAP